MKEKQHVEEQVGLNSQTPPAGQQVNSTHYEALREQDMTLFKESRDAVIISTREGKIVDVNNAALSLFGYSRDEMINMDAQLLYADPDDRAVFQQEIEKKGFVRDYKVNLRKKDGKEVKCLYTMIVKKSRSGEVLGYEGIIRDISTQVEAEELYRALANSSQVGVFVIMDGIFQFVNPHILEYSGYTENELVGKDPLTLIHPEDQKMARQNAVKMLKGERLSPYEYRSVTKEGRSIWILETVTPINFFGKRAVLGSSIDITEEKEARNKLEEVEALESSILDAIPHAVLGIENRKIIFANDAVEKVFGWKPTELIGKSTEFLYRTKEEWKEIGKRFYPVLQSESTYSEEYFCRRKDGIDILCKISTSRVGRELTEQKIVAVYEDITQEKASQRKLAELEALESSILDAIPHAVLGVENRQIFFANDSVEAVFGWKPQDMIGMSTEILYRSKEEWKEIGALFYPMLEKKSTYSAEFNCRRKDGQDMICRVSTSRVGRELMEQKIVAVYEDITEQKRAEKALKESEEKYSSVVEQAMDGIFVVQDDKIMFANRAMTIITGYSVEELTGMLFINILTASYRNLVYKRYRRRMAGEQIQPTYEAKIKCKDGTSKYVEIVFGLITIDEKLADMGHVRDITIRKKAQQELKKTAERLQKRLEETVRALASVTEKRDPYTSGHQQRVTQLACAIGREMGLNDDQMDGLMVAAMLHDIGKIYEPAELLSKPSVLNDVEFLMMKLHPEIGYDILKTIEFPWPVAQIVRQHHEKLDGSGYPDGLKGDEILLEARILTVADVVEAMASHRPYRSALGIEVALAEILKKRGTVYDPEVVDVCLNLFNEKGFEFQESSASDLHLHCTPQSQ